MRDSRRFRLAWLLAAFVAISCASLAAWSPLGRADAVMSGHHAASRPAPPKLLRVLRPPGSWDIDYLAWLAGEQALVARAYGGPTYLSDTLRIVRLGSRRPGWRRLSDLARLGCRNPALIAPLATGRRSFGFVEGCLGPNADPRTSKHVREFSFEDRRVRTLFPYGLPFPAGEFALRPDRRVGVLNDGTGLEEKLRWLLPERLSAPIRLGLDRVGQPAWSPDGRSVAVSGARGLAGEGVARSLASWRIYVTNHEVRTIKLTGGVVLEEQPSIAWSPNSQLLAVAAIGREHQGKLVLVRPRDGRHLLLERGEYGGIAWMTETTIAVVRVKNRVRIGGDYIELLDIEQAIAQLGP